MGVPKFFRWLSERYPAISQVIAENRIPEFDCLYLDMNGIIHNCTHNDSDSVTKRVSEDQMFIAIFNYIEHLFGKIKPKKLFFMAIDGVAPRAKMNQQRARRFRTALDMEVATAKAIASGDVMPEEDPFDSNCITPGTEFMAKLTKQLQYFISKKVSEDKDWMGVEVVLSGHEVPGEGEHKIMEYIRLAKAQPDYNPNVRHCLYGLDADLIMLGLSSHDPHFALLREEVTFGRNNQAKSKELEHQNFYLMHLSIVREYLELEFQELKAPGKLSFPFDMERVIDDFILLAFFIGNDFLPNLPGLHINEGALALMFKLYKEVLPKAGGYINESGKINLERLSLILEELEQFEFRVFEAECEDANWFKSKQGSHLEELEQRRQKGRLVLTPDQKIIYQAIREWLEGRLKRTIKDDLDLPDSLPARDRKFVEDLAKSLGIMINTPVDAEGNRHMQLCMQGEIDDEEDLMEEEGLQALQRVFKKYDKAPVVDASPEDQQANMERKYRERFDQWRDEYYQTKMHFSLKDEKAITELAENYVEGLQWVLYYYYRGVASWPWYYRYHYSPKISDVRKGLKANLNFKLGMPFHPFEQLMGVLPDRSIKLVPEAFHDLMISQNSPIIDFYPRDFQLDKNGKKQDWEAVVLIPFIEEDRLLKAMKAREHKLTEEERLRNTFGVTLKFSYSPELSYLYESTRPGLFPDLPHCHCLINHFDLPTIEGLDFVIGLCDGVKLGKKMLAGFPSLDNLPHRGALDFHGVNVFQMDSRNESMVITLLNDYGVSKLSEAQKMIGERAFFGYPFLQEGLITAVSDELFNYTKADDGKIIPVPHSPFEINDWARKADRIEKQYSKRLGMVIGDVDLIFHCSMLKGLRHLEDGSTIKDYDDIPGVDTDYAAQTVVFEVGEEDGRFLERAALPIQEEFPEGARAFFLGEYNYGQPLEVIDHIGDKANIWVSNSMKNQNNDFGRVIAQQAELNKYTPSYAVARILKMNNLALSKITSSFSVMVGEERKNLGLNLKFEGKKLKVIGYSRRSVNGWEFSEKAINLLQEYMNKFPEFFAVLQKNPHGDIYNDYDFYPKEEAKAKVMEIVKWLKSLPNLEKVPLDANQLDGAAVKLIEQKADELLAASAHPPPNGKHAKRVKAVPRSALLKPSDAEHRLADQQFSLGDRLVYVLDSGKVPIATRGTVVGVTTGSRITLLDVVFDVTFMSGTTLNGRCTPFRGMTIASSSALNLSNKQCCAITRASTAKQAPPPNAMPAARGGHTHQHSHHQNQQQQFASFRNAAAGEAVQQPVQILANTSNGRGRGGRGGRHTTVEIRPQAPPVGRGIQQQQQYQPQNFAPQYQHQQQQYPNGPAVPSRGRAGFTIAQRGGRGRGNMIGQAPPTGPRSARDVVQNGHPQHPQVRMQQPTPPAPVAEAQQEAYNPLMALLLGKTMPNLVQEATPQNTPPPPVQVQQSYNNVPPPPAITHPNRGRGGGRGRGRGGRGRGQHPGAPNGVGSTAAPQ